MLELFSKMLASVLRAMVFIFCIGVMALVTEILSLWSIVLPIIGIYFTLFVFQLIERERKNERSKRDVRDIQEDRNDEWQDY